VKQKKKEEAEKEKAVRRMYVCRISASPSQLTFKRILQCAGPFITFPSAQHCSCAALSCSHRHQLHQL
jgi:hypothetical protein